MLLYTNNNEDQYILLYNTNKIALNAKEPIQTKLNRLST